MNQMMGLTDFAERMRDYRREPTSVNIIPVKLLLKCVSVLPNQGDGKRIALASSGLQRLIHKSPSTNRS